MSKADLHFDLSDEADREMYALVSAIISREGWTDANQVRHASRMWSLLEKISDHLRSRQKYGEDVGDSENRLIRSLRDMIHDSGFNGWEDDGPVNEKSAEIEITAGDYNLCYYPIPNTYRVYGPDDYTGVDVSVDEVKALLGAIHAERLPDGR